MAGELLADGTIQWEGGMDTSRSSIGINDNQYVKATNVIIPSSLGGISCRFGIHHVDLLFDSLESKEIYTNNPVTAEGSFESDGVTYLIAVSSGFVFRFTEIAYRHYYVENVNPNERQTYPDVRGWCIPIPNGIIINNGYDYALYVTESTARRTDPNKGEIGIGRMGVYVQNRLFYVDQSGRRILASDFLEPIKFTREGTNIFGFSCPDDDDVITAITKQKTILSSAEGGNLVWSSAKNIYSADVRGTRTEWANLNSRIGKTTETIPGFSAASAYSFEPFNSNIYFRSKQFGICNIKQSEYQFVNLDSLTNESIEASYYLNNDTDWMLSQCYTKNCNSRLFTTVAPEVDEKGWVYWNGILSFHPAAMYAGNSMIQRRFESVFTGVRPWCLTVSKTPQGKDRMFIHSYDKDGFTRLYMMDEATDFDTNASNQRVEIKGFIETRAYSHQNPFSLKKIQRRFYRLGSIPRTVNTTVYSRPTTMGPWSCMWEASHKVGRTVKKNNLFSPSPTKPQVRDFVYMSDESFHACHPGSACLSVQYRFEFEGPINLEAFASYALLESHESTVTDKESQTLILTYTYKPNYYYYIQDGYESSDTPFDC